MRRRAAAALRPLWIGVDDLQLVDDPPALRCRGSVRRRGATVTVQLRGPRGVRRTGTAVADGRVFEVAIPLAGENRWGDVEEAPPAGRYQLWGATGRRRPQRLRPSPVLTATLPATLVGDAANVELTTAPAGRLELELARPLRVDEMGADGYRALGRRYTELVTHPDRPLADAAYFESFAGLVTGDSPRALFEEMRRRRPDLVCYWGVADRSVLVPAGATAVIVRSARWFEVLATSRFVITSHWLPGVFKRRPGQVVVQTWHGSQLKLIGSDRPKHQVQKGYVKRTARQVAQWSFLLSQSEHSTAIFRQA